MAYYYGKIQTRKSSKAQDAYDQQMCAVGGWTTIGTIYGPKALLKLGTGTGTGTGWNDPTIQRPNYP